MSHDSGVPGDGAHLSGYDAGLLILEGPGQSMTGAALWELDTATIPGGYSFDTFRGRLVERIGAVPELRIKLSDPAFNLGTPVWVDDPDFSPDNHIQVRP